MLVGLPTGATLTHMIPLDTATHASDGRRALRTAISEWVRPVGFEPTTRGLKGPCSAPELRPHLGWPVYCIISPPLDASAVPLATLPGGEGTDRAELVCDGRKWQRYPESGSTPDHAVHADLPTMTLDQLAANVEAQTQPTALTTLYIDAGHAIEPLEHPRERRLWDAWPFVTHRHPHKRRRRHVWASGLPHGSERECNRPIGRRIFESVGEQIGDHLANAVAIGFYLHGTR